MLNRYRWGTTDGSRLSLRHSPDARVQSCLSDTVDSQRDRDPWRTSDAVLQRPLSARQRVDPLYEQTHVPESALDRGGRKGAVHAVGGAAGPRQPRPGTLLAL